MIDNWTFNGTVVLLEQQLDLKIFFVAKVERLTDVHGRVHGARGELKLLAGVRITDLLVIFLLLSWLPW